MCFWTFWATWFLDTPQTSLDLDSRHHPPTKKSYATHGLSVFKFTKVPANWIQNVFLADFKYVETTDLESRPATTPDW